MMAPLFCARHDRDHFLGRQDAALQVDGDNAIEGFLGDRQQLGIAAGEADADIVVQHVDATPARYPVCDHRLDVGGFGHIGLEGCGRAVRRCDQIDGLLRRFQMMIDAEHLGALPRKGERGGAAITHAFAGALAGADDDRNLVLEAHVTSLPG